MTGAACVRALQDASYNVTPIDVQRDMGALMTRLYPKPDAIFNALHGRYGEDGCVQGLLDILGIPYTHSGLLASALAMHKPMAKKLFVAAGIPVARHEIRTQQDIMSGNVMPVPYIIKPVNEGSSVGVHIIRERFNESMFTESGWPFGDEVMVEEYIAGREMTATIASSRQIDWQSFGLNFVFILSPGIIENAPHNLVLPLWNCW